MGPRQVALSKSQSMGLITKGTNQIPDVPLNWGLQNSSWLGLP